MLITGRHENVLLHPISFLEDALHVGTNACASGVSVPCYSSLFFCQCMYLNVFEPTEGLTVSIAEGSGSGTVGHMLSNQEGAGGWECETARMEASGWMND